MAAHIDGPRLGPKSASAKQLVVFLHGYGADGNDLISIGQQWQALLPDAAFAAPNALEPCAQAPVGRQWFPLATRDEKELWAGANKAQPVLDAFLDAELERYGLGDTRLALVGFSQGTMLALHAGLRRRSAPAAILGYSGLLIGPEHLAKAGIAQPPPILLAHGDQDDVIPVDAMFVATEQLAEMGIPVQWHLAPGLGHGIDGGGLLHGGLFLARSFGLRLPETLRGLAR